MDLKPDLLRSHFCTSCALALSHLQDYYETTITVDVQSVESRKKYHVNFVSYGSKAKFRELKQFFKSSRGSIKFLINPSGWIDKTWDLVIPELYKEILLCSKIIGPKIKIRLFEIGVGTGYLLFRCKSELNNVDVAGCDIDTLKETPYTITRRLLGINENVIDLGIYESELPEQVLSSHLVFSTLPVFEEEWERSNWREFLASAFHPQLSNIKTLFILLNKPREYRIDLDVNSFNDICQISAKMLGDGQAIIVCRSNLSASN